MKNFVKATICGIITIMILIPSIAMANDMPSLKSISFANARIDGAFDSAIHEYGIILDDPAVSPAVEKYEIDGDANMLINYEYDEAKHQSGIIVTLEYSNGTIIYRFDYSNKQEFAPNSNNTLSKLGCTNGELYPALNDKTSDYKLYIPSDMTDVDFFAVTADTGAYCELPSAVKLNAGQEPTISITVIASDYSTREYTVKIKHLDKTTAQVQKEMNSPEFTSLVQGELFYQKPEFAIITASIAGGIILLMIFLAIAKRLTVKVYDDENEFFVFEEDEISKE